MNSPFLDTALEAARAAADVIRRYYQNNLKVTIKADKTPVTDADVEAAKAGGLTEDEIFELVVCAAYGQASRQLHQALAVVDAATAAHKEQD